MKIFSNKVYEQRGLDSDMAGDTGQKNKQIHNQNKIICTNSCFCVLIYYVKCDERTAILKFDVQSDFAISRRIYEIQKTQLFHYIQILANVYTHSLPKFVS